MYPHDATAATYLEVQPVASRKHEIVIFRYQLKPAIALHYAGQIGETPRPDVKVLVELHSTVREGGGGARAKK